MAKAIIHVGMHKTGSSSIQATLAQLPPGRGPTIVQIAGTPNLSGQVKRGFNSNMTPARVRTFTSETFDEKRAATKTRIKEELSGYAGQDIILSAEGFTGLTASDFAEFMTLLPDHEIEVVGYVRPPRSMMSSAFQQRLKSGLAQLNPSALIPAYRHLLEKFEQAPKFTLRLFDRKSLYKRDVVKDFCRVAGVEVQPEEIVTKNEALSLEAGRLLFTFSKWRQSVGLAKQRGFVLSDVLGRIKGEKLHLSSETINPVIAANRDSIDWVEQKLGVPFPDDTIEGGIASEAEMLAVSEETTVWLARQVRKDWKGKPGPETIGVWMQLLYEKVSVSAFKKDRRAEDDEDGLDEDA